MNGAASFARVRLERLQDGSAGMTVHEPVTAPQVAKLTVEDFLLLDRSGAFEAYAKAELIDGTIFVVNAQFSEHMKAKVRLLRRLADVCDGLGTGLEAWSEGSVALSGASMLEPDLFVTRETPTEGPVDVTTVALIVEIADATAHFDLGKKAAIYAANGVPEYWVADIKVGKLRQFWSPAGDRYAESRTVPLGELVAAMTIAGLSVSTDGL